MNDNSFRVIEVDINEILPNRFQPRIQFDEDEILELSDSIKEHGVIQPLVVRAVGDKYEIIAGERRYKASVLAGKETVPVIIKNLSDKESAEIALIENVQRKNLTAIEEALSYKNILDMGYLTQEMLAKKIGKSQSSIANKLRLLNLSDEVQEALLKNQISERHARSLLKILDLSKQNKMLDKIINERMTVRKTDEEITKMLYSNDSNDDTGESQKVIERRNGEKNMNNEMNFNSNINPSQNQGFNMFGVLNQNGVQTNNENVDFNQTTSSMSSFNTFGAPQSTQEMPSFSAFGDLKTSQEAPSFNTFEAPQPMQEASSFNSFETSQPMQEAPSFNTFEAPQPMQEAPSFNSFETSQPMQEAPSFNTFEAPQPMQEAPSFNSFGVPSQTIEASQPPSFDSFGLSSTAPTNPVPTPNFDAFSNFTENESNLKSDVPLTSPIQEDNMNVDSFGNKNQNMASNDANGPLIITDYNKQYDPIMPQSIQPTVEKIDFKEVIQAIRECSEKIEKYGYKIDLEEYDLSGMYQVVFKIDK